MKEGSISTPRQGMPLIFALMYNGPSGALIVSLGSNVMHKSLGGSCWSKRFTTLLNQRVTSLGEKTRWLVSITLVEWDGKGLVKILIFWLGGAIDLFPLSFMLATYMVLLSIKSWILLLNEKHFSVSWLGWWWYWQKDLASN